MAGVDHLLRARHRALGRPRVRLPHLDQSKSAIRAIEYGALGIPVVASDVGPYRDHIVDGVTGYLIRREHE